MIASKSLFLKLLYHRSDGLSREIFYDPSELSNKIFRFFSTREWPPLCAIFIEDIPHLVSAFVNDTVSDAVEQTPDTKYDTLLGP